MTTAAKAAYDAYEALDALVKELSISLSAIDPVEDPQTARDLRASLIAAVTARQHAQEDYARALREEATRTGRPINLTRE